MQNCDQAQLLNCTNQNRSLHSRIELWGHDRIYDSNTRCWVFAKKYRCSYNIMHMYVYENQLNVVCEEHHWVFILRQTYSAPSLNRASYSCVTSSQSMLSWLNDLLTSRAWSTDMTSSSMIMLSCVSVWIAMQLNLKKKITRIVIRCENEYALKLPHQMYNVWS